MFIWRGKPVLKFSKYIIAKYLVCKCYCIIKFVYVYQVTPSFTWINFFFQDCFCITLLIIMFDIQYWTTTTTTTKIKISDICLGAPKNENMKHFPKNSVKNRTVNLYQTWKKHFVWNLCQHIFLSRRNHVCLNWKVLYRKKHPIFPILFLNVSYRRNFIPCYNYIVPSMLEEFKILINHPFRFWENFDICSFQTSF